MLSNLKSEMGTRAA